MNTMSRVSERPAISRSASKLWILFLASLGGTLEYYDFVIFIFFTPFIGKLFFPANTPEWLRQFQVYGIFAAGYLARPLGGVVMAHFGDLQGRKRVFMFTVLLMAIPTLAIGLMPTYQSIGVAAPLLLLVMRIMQGMAIGGDVPGGCVFVAEHAKQRTGFAVGLFMAGLSGGAVLGSLVTTIIDFRFTPAQITDGAWRIVFLLGGLFGFAAVFLRRYLSETPIFQEMQRRAAIAKEVPLRTVLRDHRTAIVASLASAWALSSIVIVVILMTPAILQRMYHLPPSETQFANLLGNLGASIGGIIVGALVDRFSLRRVVTLFMLVSIPFTYLLYLGPHWMPSALPLFYLVAGLSSGALGLSPLVLVRAFPASVRFTGVSFSYNSASAIFGGLTLLLVPSMTHIIPLFPAHYVVGMTLVGILGTLLAPVARTEY